ncbi:hypothetical protein I6F30_35165 [Bradyrhizobium sp. NBAIM20]|uniref:helix-hairpin-helix domain-containing protein n=1 Tax=unclassified Bradyrhizobium TaxID=2631580 RepID=UPI001CD5B922|nr:MULTISPECIES: hypothetical protein [unclassified Bradyrhizobium]MCA1416332.1 hypothetical protein [Bradyrhizobium sp. NBAIM20]MCA1466110.1 hypothetical protein [Bradyrhizobium sp. NBAIM18]
MANAGPLTGEKFVARDAAGTTSTVRLDTLIASSGEGSVYKTDSAGQVAKIYNAPVRDHFRKLRVMLDRPPRSKQSSNIAFAWPTATLQKGNGQSVGFMMPEIPGKRPTFLYVPMTRKVDAAGVDWYHLHHAALNVALVFQSVHDIGCVIGDVKPENLLVDSQMRVCAIDTDSFQVTDPKTKVIYRCTVGTADYTPREIMGQAFADIDRVIDHDNFGLAALVYLFLFGRHPFSGGILDGPLEGLELRERIVRGLWQWNTRVPLKPHLGSLPLQMIHPELVVLMRRCFDRGHQNPKMRPTAKEWVRALGKAIDNLVWCEKAPLHVYDGEQTKCPWCELQKTGIDLFPTRAGIESTSMQVLFNRFEAKVSGGDIGGAVAMLDRHPRLRSDKRVARYQRIIDRSKADIAALESFKRDLATSSIDEYALVQQLRNAPRVRQLALADTSVSERVEQLLKIGEALDLLGEAISEAAPNNQAYAIEGERRIVDCMSQHRDFLVRAPKSFPRYRERVTDAKKRVDAYGKLGQAQATGNFQRQMTVVLEQWAILDEIAEFRAERQKFEQFEVLNTELNGFLEAAKAQDFGRLCDIWQHSKVLPGSEIARIGHEALGGQPPLGCFELAAARLKDLAALGRKLEELARPDGSIVEETERAVIGKIQKFRKRHRRAGGKQEEELDARLARAQSIVHNYEKLRQMAKSSSRTIANAWAGIAGRQHYVLDDNLRQLVEDAVAICGRVDSFLSIATATDPDENALQRLVATVPDILDLEAESDAGIDFQKRVALSQRRIEGLAALEAAVADADSWALKTEHGEAALVTIWTRYAEDLAEWPTARRIVGSRLDLAAQRIRRSLELQHAFDRHDQTGIAKAWGTDGILSDYAPTQRFRALAERSLEMMSALRNLSADLKSDPYRDQLIQKSCREFESRFGQEADVARQELDGRSVKAVEQEVSARLSMLAVLRQGTLNHDQQLGIARAREIGIGLSQSDLRLHAKAIADAEAFSKRWATFVEAVRAGNTATVAGMWRDDQFSTMRAFQPWKDVVAGHLQEYLNSRNLFSSANPDQVSTQRPGELLLQWNWRDAAVTHALIMTGDRSAPESEREYLISRVEVQRATYEAQGGFVIPFSGRSLTALIFPGIAFCGIIMWGPNKLVLHETKRRLLTYNVRIAQKLSGAQELELSVDRAMQIPLPPLKIVADQAQPPGSAPILIERILVNSEGQAHVQLPGTAKFWSRRSFVKLDLQSETDAEWLEIRHPLPGQRMMSLP